MMSFSGMRINRIRVYNIGPIEDLDLVIDGETVAFVGVNASGKTLLLSSVVDFIFEHMKGFGFDDVLPILGSGYRYFRLTSGSYRNNLSKPGFIWIEGKIGNSDLFYIEEYGINDVEEASKLIKTDTKNIPWPNKGYSRNINTLNNDDSLKARDIARNSSIFYLPATRFEDDSWKTGDFYIDDQSIDTPFSTKLGHPIELYKSIQDNLIWLTNEVFDAAAFRGSKDERLRILSDLCNEKLSLITDLLSRMLDGNCPILLNFGPDRGDRLSLINSNGNTVLESLRYLSLGQKAILNLVLNILRLGDRYSHPQDLTGLIVIDEIDAHLTGDYRSTIIPHIINLFPSVQFIISSHDPVSIVGLENNCFIKIIDLPTGNEIFAKDFKELEEVRCGLKTLNDELRNIVKIIKSISKPILLVEDSRTEIYKVAWLKIHSIDFNQSNINDVFNKYSPFEVISANGFNNLYHFLNMNIFPSDLINKNIVGLFDFDEAYNCFSGLDSTSWGSILGSASEGLYRINTKYPSLKSLILPVPNHRANIASVSFGGNSRLCIELYFRNKTLGVPNCSYDESRPGKIIKFKGSKAVFWKKCIKYDSSVFRPFRKLFDRVEELFNS